MFNILHPEYSSFHLHSLALCLAHAGTQPPFVEGINESCCKHLERTLFFGSDCFGFFFIVTMVYFFVLCFTTTLPAMLSNLAFQETELIPYNRCLGLGLRMVNPERQNGAKQGSEAVQR